MVLLKPPSKHLRILSTILQRPVFDDLVPLLTNKLVRIAAVALQRSPHLLANAMTQWNEI